MGSGLTTTELHRLDRACVDLHRAFPSRTYLVGSAYDGDTFRDVDVRTILDDDEFDIIFGPRPQFWGLVCVSVATHLSDTTGLRVDYQIQRLTEANEKHDGPRNPLGQFIGKHAGREFAGLGDATLFAPTPDWDVSENPVVRWETATEDVKNGLVVSGSFDALPKEIRGEWPMGSMPSTNGSSWKRMAEPESWSSRPSTPGLAGQPRMQT
jgi:hypothetical protein